MSDSPAQSKPNRVVVGAICLLLMVGAIAAIMLSSGRKDPRAPNASSGIGSAPSRPERPGLPLADPKIALAPAMADASPRATVGAGNLAATTPAPAIAAEDASLPPQVRNLVRQNKAGVAKVTIDGHEIELPNHAGHYERAQISTGKKIRVDLAYPGDDPSADVFAHAIQGGTINGESAQRFDLTRSKQVSFDFSPAAEPGLYEVLLRRGAQEEVLQFWVPTVNPSHDPTLPAHR